MYYLKMKPPMLSFIFQSFWYESLNSQERITVLYVNYIKTGRGKKKSPMTFSSLSLKSDLYQATVVY